MLAESPSSVRFRDPGDPSSVQLQRLPLSDSKPRAVAVVVREGRVLVMRRHLDGRDYAVLPGGGSEDAGDAALRELREECTLNGQVGDLLLVADHGGRSASYFWIDGVEGEPVLDGDEAQVLDESNRYELVWASPSDLAPLGLLPEEIIDHVAQWLRLARPCGVETELD